VDVDSTRPLKGDTISSEEKQRKKTARKAMQTKEHAARRDNKPKLSLSHTEYSVVMAFPCLI